MSPHRRIRTTPRELRGQLIIFVVVLWAVGAFNLAGSNARLIGGRGSDFLHFYSLARIGAYAPASFADPVRVREAQLQAVPESIDHQYPPVYGPQVAIALSPLAHFSYRTALVIWSLLITILYFAAVAIVMSDSRVSGRYRSLGLLAAAGFPPFWYLVQYGQLSGVALCLIVAAAALMRRARPIAAGAVLGLLIYKPPLFAPILAIVLVGGSWMVATAMLASGAIEVLATVFWVGIGGIEQYVELMWRLPRMASVMAARPDQMHSLRAFWSLLFGNSAFTVFLYAVTAAVAIGVAAYVWRKVEDPSLKMAALLLGTALASPHFYVYDLVILAPAWVWLTDWYLNQTLPRRVGRTLYVGYLAALFGYVATFVPLQLSVLCSAYLLVALGFWSRGVLAAPAAKRLDVADLVATGAGIP